MRRRLAVLATVAAVGVVGVGMPSFSTAAFSARTASTATVQAAVDWTPPQVAMTHPGPTLKGTVALAATASDAETGVKDVVIQHQPVGSSTWTTVCTTTTAPYTCSWATTAVPDGQYDLRARATDNAGYATTSASVRTTVANNVLVVLADPADVVRGTVPLSTTVHSGGTATWTVRVEYTPTGTTSWKSICTNLAAPYTCQWATTGYANAEYDLRAVATSGGATVTSAVVVGVLVDNLAPTVTMTDPGTPLRGTVTLAAVADDAHSGVAQVVVQAAPAGTTTFTELCTVTTAPWSCRYDTTRLVDGTYDLRAVATDVAGNTATSSSVRNRAVDNTVSAVSLEDPGTYLSGRVTLLASASSTAGVTSVTIQRAVAGGTTWTDVCTVTTSPYSCSWDTATVPDGRYDLRAVLVDRTGGVTVSAVVAGRVVDNVPFRAVDVQTANGGGTPGKMDAGDTMTFTYSQQAALGTISPGWNGSAVPVTLRIRDGNLLNLGNKGDTIDVQRTGSVVNLGSVNLREDYVKSSKTATFTATMTGGTVTAPDGTVRTTVTITLGALASGGGTRTVTTAAAMVWTPSGSVTDLLGLPCSTAPVTELGALDREF
ncbi:MAG: signal peptidase I [Actinotalea sp.]|nr:signal peptidase I [Actinotalea sp.]